MRYFGISRQDSFQDGAAQISRKSTVDRAIRRNDGNDGDDAWGSQRPWHAHPMWLVPTRNRALSERNPTTHVQSDSVLSDKRLSNDHHSRDPANSVKMVRTYLHFSCSHAVSILEIRRSSVENSVLGDESRYLFGVEDD